MLSQGCGYNGGFAGLAGVIAEIVVYPRRPFI